MHLTSKQATEQYKVSIRTLRTLIAGLTAEQKQMHLLIKGKQHLISTELLNQHYQARPGAKVQSKDAKQVQNDTTATDAPPTDTATDAKQVQNDVKQVQNELIAHLTNEVAHLQNANVQLNERLKENNYIIANLTKQIAPPPPTDTPGPKPNTTTDTPFIWFIVGLVFGLFVVGVVVIMFAF